jgi:hypothetical protein
MKSVLIALLIGSAGIVAGCSSSGDEGQSGANAFSENDGQSAPAGSISLDDWRNNAQMKPLLQILIALKPGEGTTNLHVDCDDNGLSSLQTSDASTHVVREVFQTVFDELQPNTKSTEKFWYYDASGKLVLHQISKISETGSVVSSQYVFVKDDKSILQIVAPRNISFIEAAPGEMLASDPKAQQQFGMSEHALTPEDLSNQHPEFHDESFRTARQCSTPK